jgi:hypothetical protein
MCFKSIKHAQLNKSEVTILGSVYGKLTVAEDTLQSIETEVRGLYISFVIKHNLYGINF